MQQAGIEVESTSLPYGSGPLHAERHQPKRAAAAEVGILLPMRVQIGGGHQNVLEAPHNQETGLLQLEEDGSSGSWPPPTNSFLLLHLIACRLPCPMTRV